MVSNVGDISRVHPIRITAFPENVGAEAPEQPQNSRQSEKRAIFLSVLALAAGAKKTNGNRTAAGHLTDRRITIQLLRRRHISKNLFI